MILISHRGNIDGRFESYENEPTYVDRAIDEGYDVEIDVWYKDDRLWLGHDEPQFEISYEWIADRLERLWIHCKNVEAVEFFAQHEYNYNFFWHQEDTLTLTSKGYVWVYPGKQPIKNSIAVMPEIHQEDVTDCFGICSDFIKQYEKNII